jgi:chitin disaccharide deacetylase
VIIINADDFGRSEAETDAALHCFENGRLTSATAMVFMQDSSRAADAANAVGLDVGLHLNLSQAFDVAAPARVQECHARIVRFLARSKYASIVYHPGLREQFRYVYHAQVEEFVRLYGRHPSHIDGHQHKHLCTNMLVDAIIPARERVRRSFSFWPGEKSAVNRGYRRVVDSALGRLYRRTDFFFGLQECLEMGRMPRVFELAQSSAVELMTHPLKSAEYRYLMSDTYIEGLRGVATGTYSSL